MAPLPARYAAATRVNGATVNSELWVTTVRTGCTVLVLDWGNHRYSVFHIQPSADHQFNRFGQGVIGTGRNAGAAYKNVWLRSEANTVVTKSANRGATPQQYIMVQSMFTNVSGWLTHVTDVHDVNDFIFCRKRTNPHGSKVAERLGVDNVALVRALLVDVLTPRLESATSRLKSATSRLWYRSHSVGCRTPCVASTFTRSAPIALRGRTRIPTLACASPTVKSVHFKPEVGNFKREVPDFKREVPDFKREVRELANVLCSGRSPRTEA